VKEAGKTYSPSGIANYCYELVKEYNQFYHDFSILREENESLKVFRLALSANVAKIVRLGMLLGYTILAVPTGIVSASMIKESRRLDHRSCPNCQRMGHEENARYCKHCGAELEEEV